MDASDWYVLGSILLLVALLIYWLLIKLLPADFGSTQRDVRLLSVVFDVPRDTSFQTICKMYCKLTTEQVKDLNRILTDSIRLRIVSDYVFRCGWIGQVSGQDYIGLALPARWPAFLLMTVTIHELFHLIRHVQKVAELGYERKRYIFDPRRIWMSLSEEGTVWRKTARVDQIGSVIILSPLISFPFMYCLLTVYILQQFRLFA